MGTSNKKVLSGELKHSKLPWLFDGETLTIWGKEPHESLEASPDEIACYVDKDNAEFIVKCVNSHYQLLEACKKVLNDLPLIMPSYDDTEEWEGIVNTIKKAIAKADGK